MTPPHAETTAHAPHAVASAYGLWLISAARGDATLPELRTALQQWQAPTRIGFAADLQRSQVQPVLTAPWDEAGHAELLAAVAARGLDWVQALWLAPGMPAPRPVHEVMTRVLHQRGDALLLPHADTGTLQLLIPHSGVWWQHLVRDPQSGTAATPAWVVPQPQPPLYLPALSLGEATLQLSAALEQAERLVYRWFTATEARGGELVDELRSALPPRPLPPLRAAEERVHRVWRRLEDTTLILHAVEILRSGELDPQLVPVWRAVAAGFRACLATAGAAQS